MILCDSARSASVGLAARLLPLVAWALALAACAPDPERLPPPVVVISIDTVRADELGVYGAPEGSTPVLDAFAASATRYANSISSAPWTLPSHASMFTGLFPVEHGARSFLPEPGYRGDNVYALAPYFETLAEGLAARGYRAGGVVANSIYLRPGLGLEQGFLDWEVQRAPAHVITARALAWLDRSADSARPTFLFVNYIDAHRPYRTGDEADRPTEKLDALIQAVMVEGRADPELAAEVHRLHQKAVTRLDAELEHLFDGLKRRGLFERSLIVVTSDHGEAFGEHGLVEHSKDVYEELLRVPLLVKEPGQTEGRVVDTLASSVDVPGLVARALAGTDAASLAAVFPRVPGNHPVLAENSFSRVPELERFGARFQRERRAIYGDGWKLIRGTDGTVELYRLTDDAVERVDLGAANPAVVAALGAALDEFVAQNAFDGEPALPGDLTPKQRADFGELGYGASTPSGR